MWNNIKQTIDTKAEIILDHFIPKIVNTEKIKRESKSNGRYPKY